MQIKLFPHFAMSVFLVAAMETATANIIDDTHGVGAGSFERGNFINNGSGWMWLRVGSTTMTGWTVGGPGNGVDWLTTPTFGTANGLHSVDLTDTLASSISTTIPTITGAIYNLSFEGAAWVSGTSNTGLVTAGSLAKNFTVSPSSTLAGQKFYTFSFQFTATSVSTTISFLSKNQSGFFTNTYGPVVDNVSVNFVNSVPVPATFWLFGAALLVFLGRSGVGRGLPLLATQTINNNRLKSEEAGTVFWYPNGTQV
jgi:hypothetical protein